MIRKKFNLPTSLFFVLLSISLIFAPMVSAVELVISGNGSESDNTISTEIETQTTVVQENNSSAENNVEVNSNTGENSANDNSGEVNIETGDTATEVIVENQLNTSSAEVECCLTDPKYEISDNGSGSDNTIQASVSNNTTIVVSQDSKIKNDISGSSNTGDNTASDNNGDVVIKTGDIHVSGELKNSTNISTVASATGVGSGVSVLIADNGTDSKNSISVRLLASSDIVREDLADIDNHIDWDLNTGGNVANDNFGDIYFSTGDIFFDFAITNDPVNIGGVDIDCCAVIDDGDDGDNGDGGDNGNGDDGDDNNGGDQGNGDGDGDGNGDDEEKDEPEGKLLATAAATTTEILGLSDTSSDEQRGRAFWIGFALLAFGIKLLGDGLQRYNDLQLDEEEKTS